MGRGGLVDIPFRSFAGKRALEQMKTDGVIGNGVGGTLHVKRADMVGGILSSQAFKLWDVGRELCQHSRPTSIMVYRVVYQPVQIGEAEACQEGEQGCSRGSSCGGSASSSSGIRAGSTASVRPWTRHSEGDKG